MLPGTYLRPAYTSALLFGHIHALNRLDLVMLIQIPCEGCRTCTLSPQTRVPQHQSLQQSPLPVAGPLTRYHHPCHHPATQHSTIEAFYEHPPRAIHTWLLSAPSVQQSHLQEATPLTCIITHAVILRHPFRSCSLHLGRSVLMLLSITHPLPGASPLICCHHPCHPHATRALETLSSCHFGCKVLRLQGGLLCIEHTYTDKTAHTHRASKALRL